MATDPKDKNQADEARSYERTANRYVSRARKELDLTNKPGDDQAAFYLSAAQTYATLELAQAIRDSGGL
jgi:hypothetical protein